MKIDTYVCEFCGKRTEDVYARGWLQLRGSLVRGQGRDKNGQVVSDYLEGSTGNDATFCSGACLGKKLDGIAESRKKP